MPDFTHINVRACESVRYFNTIVIGSKGTKYKVTCTYGEWHCPCEGFKFRGKCRHVQEASKAKCNWSEEWGDGKARLKKGEYVCPCCNGDTFVYKAVV